MHLILAILLSLLPTDTTRRAECDVVELNRYPGGWGVATQMLAWRGCMVQEHHPMTNGQPPPHLFLPDEGRYAVGVLVERSKTRRLEPGEGTGVVRKEWDEPAIIYCDQIIFTDTDYDMDGEIFVSPAMYDLIQHADQGELKQLLAAIPVLTLRGSVVRLKYAKVEPSFI